MRFRHITRGGPHVRVADAAWLRPLDPRFAQERGGRWNPPHSFPVVYLCATRDVARAVVLRRFEGLPYGVVDLLPSRAPVLIATDVPEARLVDVVGDAGCRAAGLPASYPLDGRGRPLAWGRTQPVVPAQVPVVVGLTSVTASMPRLTVSSLGSVAPAPRFAQNTIPA